MKHDAGVDPRKHINQPRSTVVVVEASSDNQRAA
jgi:hypothetical protein